MKRFLAVTACIFICGTSLAQKSEQPPKKNPNKSGIAGTILNMRKQPQGGIRAIVYKKDSIAASGFTDSMGYFETNFVTPGLYGLKLVYPSEKTLFVTSVPIKARTLTMINIKANLPEADTVLAYSQVAPPAPAKK